MAYRVFAQAEDARIDLARLVRHASNFFSADLEVLGQSAGPQELPELNRVELNLTERSGDSSRFQVFARPASSDDHEDARVAEVNGRASGMSDLARRCRYVWEIEAPQAAGESLTLRLCGILASTGLGPVLPKDRSTLLGVRSVMARLEKLAQKA